LLSDGTDIRDEEKQQRKEDVRFHATYSRVNNTSAKCEGSKLALDTSTLRGIVDELTNRTQQSRNKRDADQNLANDEEDRAEAMKVVLK
jgi:hypothetical protein